MKKYIGLIAALLILSAVLGWMRAGTSAGTRTAEIDNWDSLKYEAQSKAGYQTLAGALKDSALLPFNKKEKKALEEIEAASTARPAADGRLQSAPPFPKILGSSRLDNKRYIHVMGPGETVEKHQKGDVLENGWEIKTVDRKQVIAVFDGEELEIPIISYLEAAYEKPKERSDDEEIENGTDAQSGGE